MINEKPNIQRRSFEFAVRVIKLCQYLDERSSVERTLARQLLRAGTSIGANIEEAQGGQRRADFISKMSIALKEARETLYWLRLLSETQILSEHKIADLKDEASQLTKILGATVVSTKKSS